MRYVLVFLAAYSISWSVAYGAEVKGLNSIIQVYTANYPPYSYRGETGKIEGISTNKVRQLLDSIGLEYEVIIVPWSRALLLVQEDQNALLYSFDRTAEREKEYHWILPLNIVESHLFGRRDTFEGQFSKPDVISGRYKAACSKNSSSCELLRGYGFGAASILAIAARSPEDLLNLISRKRADFILEDPNALSADKKVAFDIRSYDIIDHGVTDYLAAGKNANPEMLKILQDHASSVVVVK